MIISFMATFSKTFESGSKYSSSWLHCLEFLSGHRTLFEMGYGGLKVVVLIDSGQLNLITFYRLLYKEALTMNQLPRGPTSLHGPGFTCRDLLGVKIGLLHRPSTAVRIYGDFGLLIQNFRAILHATINIC